MKTKKEQVPSFKESDYEDLMLISFIKRGDQNACRKLFKKYAPILTRRFRTNFKNQEDLRDVVIEIMQKMFENIDRYERHYTFNSWITALAHNYMTDHFRKKKRKVSDINSFSIDIPISTDTGESVMIDLPDDSPEHMVAAPEIERQASLEYVYKVIDRFQDETISSFPKETRELFLNYKIKGQSLSEIAKETGLTFSEVRKKVYSVRDAVERTKLEQRMLEMYLKKDMSYELIAKKLKMNLNTLKVKLMRAKQHVIDTIDPRIMVMEISSIYTLEQLKKENFVLTSKENLV